MKRGLSWVSAGLAAAAFWGTATRGLAQSAEQAAGDPTVYTLGQIVVSAERRVVESAGTVREVTAEQIAERRVHNLEQALRLLPGVDIRTATDGIARVDIRGLRSRHVLLLLNGIPFNSTEDGQFDPSIIPVENIARIKVSYGTHSVLYGQGGLGGVIDIITKKGTDQVASTALAEYGQSNQWTERATMSGGKGPATFFVGASNVASDGFRLSDDFHPTSEEHGGVRDNSDFERGNVFANLDYTPAPDWELGLVANVLTGQFGKPPITINDKDDIFATSPKYDRVTDYTGEAGQLSAAYHPDGPVSVRGWGYYNRLDQDQDRYDDNHYNSMDDPAVKGTYDEEDTSEIFGGTVQTAIDLDKWGTLTCSVSGEDQSFDSHGVIRDVEKKAASLAEGSGAATKGKTYDTRAFRQDNSLDIYSTAFEYEKILFERLGLVAGYSHHWLDKNGGSDDDWGGLVGMHFDVRDGTQLHASAARKIRFPSLRQLYGIGEGNPDLTTETSVNYETGVTQDIGALTSVALTGFFSDVKDYIEKDDATDTFSNHDKYHFAGLEWAGETRIIPRLVLRSGYTYLYSRDESSHTEKKELQYRPEHKVSFEGIYTFDWGLSLRASVIRVMQQYYYSKNPPLQKARLNDFTLMDLKAEQALFDDVLHVYVNVENLFDRDHEEAYGFPRAGRTVFAGVELRL